MTKAEAARTSVLAAAEEGLSEAEISARLGIPESRVLRILDTVEAAPKREVEPSERGKKAPRQFQHKSFISVNRPPDKPRTYTPTGNPIGRARLVNPAHGTKSGYDRHLFLKETACDACKKAVRDKAAKVRHDRWPTFANEEECSIYLAGVLQRMIMFRCDSFCRDWHVTVPTKTKLTREELNAFHRTASMRRKRRQRALDTLRNTSVG